MKQASQPLPEGFHGAPMGYSPPSSHPPNPKPSVIEASIWRQAEHDTMEIIRRILPRGASEKRRMVIMEYVQNLIRTGLTGIETLPFGSFPLKTYLPDGDIDLTAICALNSEVSMTSYVRAILENEELKPDSEFVVRDVQYIGAEVKIIKCSVQNVMVDISFNQIGGLCSLCFLELIDRCIGKDHLFKRSIMLVKAWCYYESRILGSHQSLMSTYSVEILVLYIFHFFHSSLDGPLAVLYRFLDYYSKFDWDMYCITLRGPVSLSSLPELLVETFDNDGGDLLLTEDFLRSYLDFFSVAMSYSEGTSRIFARKHMNIVDPLKENNNLGRSVSQSSLHRIRSALTFGARKLEQLLSLPAARLGEELNIFSINTVVRHGGGEMPDVQDLVARSPRSALVELSGAELMQPVAKLEKEKADELGSESLTSKADKDLKEEMKNITISGLDEGEDTVALQKTSVSRSLTESPKTSPSTKEDEILDFRNPDDAPHLFFNPEIQTKEDLKLDQSLDPSDKEIIISMQPDSRDGLEGNEGKPNKIPFLLDELLDLSGDYVGQLDNLNYAVYCHELMRNPHFFTMGHTAPYSDFIHGQDAWTYGSWLTGPISPSLPVYPAACYSANLPFISSGYNTNVARNSWGTGAFIPIVNYHADEVRHSPKREKKAASEPVIQTQIVFGGNGFVKLPTRSDAAESSSQCASKAPPNTRGSVPLEYDMVQFGTLTPVLLEAPTKEHGKKLDFPISQTQGAGFISPTSSSLRPAMNSDTERKSFQMKDEDFPPLSG